MTGRLTVDELRRIATEVVEAEHPDLAMVGVTFVTSGSDYVEVLVQCAGCHEGPCGVVVGIRRNAGIASVREQVAAGLQGHRSAHCPVGS